MLFVQTKIFCWHKHHLSPRFCHSLKCMTYIKTLHILFWSMEFMVQLLLVNNRIFFTANFF